MDIKEEDKMATCQYCLMDGRYTTLATDKTKRCPICGTFYTGPRRSKEYAVLRDAGLIKSDEE